MQPLRWSRHPELVVLPTPGDGSCSLHAIVQGFHPDYQAGRNIDGTPVNRNEFVRAFRDELAEMLNKPVDENSSLTWYDRLSRGTLEDFATATKNAADIDTPDLSRQGFEQLLRSNTWLGQEIIEYVGSVLRIGVFVLLEDLSGNTRGLYSLGKESGIYFEGRTMSVIIVSHANRHYSTVGRRDPDGSVRTAFNMEDPLIKEFMLELS